MGMVIYTLETLSVSPICFLLTQVMAVQEVAQVMTASLYMEVAWRDEGLAWDPEDYANISRAYLPAHR